MRDNDLRKNLLLQFYARRGEGRLGINTGNTAPLRIPEGFAKEDVLRVCERLANSRMIDWTNMPGPGGTMLAGAGEINATGILAVEKKLPAVFGAELATDAGPAAAGDDDARLEALEQYAEYLIRGLAAAHGSAEERSVARAKLTVFLPTDDGRAIFGGAVPALLKLLLAFQRPSPAA
jgi:hypothetical protein